MIKNTVYLVKFETGYYAKKQPNYHWSFTDDPYLATHYKTRKMAEERGVWGVNLGTLGTDTEYPFEARNHQLLSGTTYTIEQYTLKTVLELNTEKESK
jgi:hypothetical protein